MRLHHFSLENFRNIPLSRLSLEGQDAYFIGQNGQGKTNLLEAMGYLTALRSFRTAEGQALVRNGQSEARLLALVEHEQLGQCDVLITLAKGRKEARVNGETINRLANFIGCFPTVTLCSDDIQLLRGGPGLRRRWLDMVLAACSKEYFEVLTRYHRCLKERNQLLKQQATPASLLAFEKPQAEAAVALVKLRQEGVAALRTRFREAYDTVASAEEAPELQYKADRTWAAPDEALQTWAENRPRELAMGSTRHGPHRDDLLLSLNQLPAREYASEGQQRSLVLCLKLAEATALHLARQSTPVILADDVLGELDTKRHEGFWAALPKGSQVIATGTRPPLGPWRQWQNWQVNAGVFNRAL